MSQIELFDRPAGVHRPVARRTDRATSHEAANSVTTPTIQNTQQLILRILVEHGPATDEQIAARIPTDYKVSPSGLRTRRSELVGLGKVRDSGLRRPLSSGRFATVWEKVA